MLLSDETIRSQFFWAKGKADGSSLLRYNSSKAVKNLGRSDCETLIRELGRKGEVGTLMEIQAVKNLLSECKFIHIGRAKNRVAHNLAQEAIRRKSCVVMRHDAPQCVRGLINKAATRAWVTQSCNLDEC
jgi:hypothetical protein